MSRSNITLRTLVLVVFSFLLLGAVMFVSTTAEGQARECLPDVEEVAEHFPYSIAYHGRVTVDGVPYGEHARISSHSGDLVTGWLQIGPGGAPSGCPPGMYMILVKFAEPLPADADRQVIFVFDDAYVATQRPQIPERLESPIIVELDIDFVTLSESTTTAAPSPEPTATPEPTPTEIPVSIADIRTGGRTFSRGYLPVTLLVGAVLLTIVGVGLLRASRRRT